MRIEKREDVSKYIRFSVEEDGNEIAHAYLYLLYNDSNKQPIGYMEDVFVTEECRGGGVGTQLLNDLIREARRQGCYKLIGTSRFEREKVHKLYIRLGFVEWGKEFRMNLSDNDK